MAAGGAIGGAGLLGIAVKLWKMISDTQAGAQRNELGTEFDKHLYERLKELEAREKETNAKLLEQAELIGELRATINRLQGDVKDLENFKSGYNRLKAENAKYRRRLGDALDD